MSWYLAVLCKYAVFTGRARRMEYWSFTLINLVIFFCWLLFDRIVFGPDEYILSSIYGLIVFLPSTAVYVRRLHDIDYSGWWLLAALIPLLGLILSLYFMLKDSYAGENQYGKNPKGVNNGVERDFNKSMSYPDNNSSDNLKNSDDSEIESKLYEQAWNEIKEETYDLGLWAKVFALCDGDEKQTKALYIKSRVAGLQNQTKTKINNSDINENKTKDQKKSKKLDYADQKYKQIKRNFSKDLHKIERRTLRNIENIKYKI